jgi:predicted fused transcriptional regulator/phosphomethylpyrimidine kinase
MPAVGMNIASCNKGARTLSEVAAFSGKISIVGDKLRHHETPSFGVSNHLAGMLLQAHIMNDAKTSIININPRNDGAEVDKNKIQKICEQLGYTFALASKGKISGSHAKLDVILDIGDFGWEPSMYILAHNPLELIDRAHQIVASL